MFTFHFISSQKSVFEEFILKSRNDISTAMKDNI